MTACPTASVPPETAMTSALPNFWLNKVAHAEPQSGLAADAAGTASHIPPPATAAAASTAARRPGALLAFVPCRDSANRNRCTLIATPLPHRVPAPGWYLVMPAARSGFGRIPPPGPERPDPIVLFKPACDNSLRYIVDIGLGTVPTSDQRPGHRPIGKLGAGGTDAARNV